MNQQTTHAAYPYTTEIFGSVIAEACKVNEQLGEALEKNPKATVERLLQGKSLPESFAVNAHRNSADTWHLTIPCYSELYQQEVERVLEDADLENISAGEVVYAIGGFIITVAGVSSATAAAIGSGGAAIIGGITLGVVGATVAAGITASIAGLGIAGILDQA